MEIFENLRIGDKKEHIHKKMLEMIIKLMSLYKKLGRKFQVIKYMISWLKMVKKVRLHI